MITKVTIGLCVKNSAKNVKTAFVSVSIQDYSHELMKLVIVVDGSSDNTLSLAIKFAQETDIPTFVMSNKDKGLGAARQLVVDSAEGDYIVWVDDDFVLTKDFIRNQIEFMEKNPNVGAAIGAYNEFSTQHVINLYDFGRLVPSKTLNSIATGGAIFRLKALESVGGFDVRIKGACEDIDVSRRIRESGWTLAVNKSAGFHEKYPPETLKALWKRSFWYGYGGHFMFHKYKRPLYSFFPPYALLIGLKMASKIYRITNMKKVFFFSVLHSFASIVSGLGFACAHLDGYGHVKGT